MAADGGLPFYYPYAPYCGSPPNPESLLYRWNLDPILLIALAAPLIAYAVLGEGRNAGRVVSWRRRCFYLGWLLGALALTSPLCPLSVSLFSARVGQHMLLTTIVAPLIVLGQPGRVWWGDKLSPPLLMRARLGPLWSAAAFAAMLWFWHAPGPYTATFESDLVYWLMHLTTFGAACWLWSALLDGAAGRLAGFVAATVLTTGQMGLLGAVITFAGRPLYPPHQFTTLAWGILPMTDQQLGGVIMWVPAGVIFAGALAFAFTEALRRAEGGGVSGSLARG